jgi:hypothetical protein
MGDQRPDPGRLEHSAEARHLGTAIEKSRASRDGIIQNVVGP